MEKLEVASLMPVVLVVVLGDRNVVHTFRTVFIKVG